MVGIREAQVEKVKPEIKKKMLRNNLCWLRNSILVQFWCKYQDTEGIYGAVAGVKIKKHPDKVLSGCFFTN
jgi:hypothetical protein